MGSRVKDTKMLAMKMIVQLRERERLLTRIIRPLTNDPQCGHRTPWLPRSFPPRLLYVLPPARDLLSGIATIYSAQGECATTITTAIKGVGVASGAQFRLHLRSQVLASR